MLIPDIPKIADLETYHEYCSRFGKDETDLALAWQVSDPLDSIPDELIEIASPPPALPIPDQFWGYPFIYETHAPTFLTDRCLDHLGEGSQLEQLSRVIYAFIPKFALIPLYTEKYHCDKAALYDSTYKVLSRPYWTPLYRYVRLVYNLSALGEDISSHIDMLTDKVMTYFSPNYTPRDPSSFGLPRPLRSNFVIS